MAQTPDQVFRQHIGAILVNHMAELAKVHIAAMGATVVTAAAHANAKEQQATLRDRAKGHSDAAGSYIRDGLRGIAASGREIEGALIDEAMNKSGEDAIAFMDRLMGAK
jgi:hypothetical protein